MLRSAGGGLRSGGSGDLERFEERGLACLLDYLVTKSNIYLTWMRRSMVMEYLCGFTVSFFGEGGRVFGFFLTLIYFL